MRKRAALVGIIVAILVVGVLVVRRHAVIAALIPRVIGAATGYDVQIGEERIGFTHGALLHVRVTKGGEPVLAAQRIDIWYNARDLLPGSAHRYGVSAIAIDAPTLTLVRHKDGSYNVSLLRASTQGPEVPHPYNHVPIALTVRIRNGSGALRAPYAFDPQARNLSVTGLKLDADINTLARTHYTLAGAFIERVPQPFSAIGTIDVHRGYAMHHVWATAVPMRAIGNFLVNSKAAQILAGTATNLNFRAYALGIEPGGAITYSIGGTLDVADAQMQIAGIAQPLRGIAGRLQLVDDTFFARDLSATLAGVPVRVNGGIIDFADPRYQLGITTRGDLYELRNAFAFAREEPIAGAADVTALVRGKLDSPEIDATLDAPAVVYDTIPIRSVHASIAYANSIVTIAPLEADVSGAHATLRGMLTIGDAVHSQLALHVDGTADELPYAGELLGAEPVALDALLDGIGTDFEGYGALVSTASPARVAAAFQLQRGGILEISPFGLHTQRGSVDGAYRLDRRHDSSAFWVVAHNVTLSAPKRSGAFGSVLPVLPAIEGTIDEFAAQGGGASGLRAMVGGTIRAHGTTIASVRLAHLSASFAGTLGDAAVDPFSADGPWGRLTGTGALSLHALAVRGAYRGTLEGLQPFLAGMPASGNVEGTAALAIEPGRITVQADRLNFQNAVVRGVPLQSAGGTLVVENGNVRLYSARASLAGGDVVAAGAYASGIALVATHLDGAHVRGFGIPIDAGVVSARGSVTAGAPLPQFDGGFSVANGRAQRYAVVGSGLVQVRGDTAYLQHVVGAVDGAYAYASGDITQLTSGAPGYALHAQFPAADLARALHTLSLPTLYSDGTFNADLAITGSGLRPHVRGPVGVPAGSVNGLPFVDGSALVAASTAGAVARQGSVQVGTTHLAFDGAKYPRISAIHVNAPRADLSDFNNFFDTGDTLDGSGRLRFDVISQRHRISSNADIAVRALRYRNLTIGDTSASWSSARNVLKGTLAVTGDTGTLHAAGFISAATDRSPLAVLRDSRYDLNLDLENLDLSTWISALGFPQVPITGRLAGAAHVLGRYPALHLTGTTQLTNGTIWRLPIESADLAFASRNRSIDLTSASLVAPGITATATGTFGLQTSDPLKLSVYLNSNDVPRLVAQLYRIQVPVSGDFESTITVGGSIAKPTFAAAFDAVDATYRGVKVPSVFGSLALVRGAIELRNVGAQFQTGDVSIAGTLPLSIAPFGVGPASAPVSMDLAVNGVDPAVFAPLFGNGTKLGGKIDGALGISGTVGSPLIYGKFGIAGGSYVSNLELVPIQDITATLQFSRVDASVSALSARFGSGTLAGAGHIAFANGASFAVNATARGAQLNLPKFGSGTLDGAVSLTRVVGQPAMLSGNATLSNAAIPFSAFLAATQSGSSDAGPVATLPFGLGFDMKLVAGHNVRVRGSSFGAGLDIGGTGSVALAGTLAAPTLDGRFTSTGGTLTYFDRAFRVQEAHVAFDPTQGILPTLHAVGTTHVSNGDPNSSRNPFGSTDVTIKVDGPLNGLSIGFSTNPPGYSNEQVLAMLAPFGGLISGAAYEPWAMNTINGVVPLGALSPLPAVRTPGGTSQSVSIGQEAFNILNAQFATGLLSPVENALQNGLGIQNVNVTLDYYGNVGISATRLLGKTVNVIYSTTFGIPLRQSIGFQLVGANNISAQLSFYVQNGNPTLFRTFQPSLSANSALAVGQPLQGSSGFAFTLQRLFW